MVNRIISSHLSSFHVYFPSLDFIWWLVTNFHNKVHYHNWPQFIFQSPTWAHVPKTQWEDSTWVYASKNQWGDRWERKDLQCILRVVWSACNSITLMSSGWRLLPRFSNRLSPFPWLLLSSSDWTREESVKKSTDHRASCMIGMSITTSDIRAPFPWYLILLDLCTWMLTCTKLLDESTQWWKKVPQFSYLSKSKDTLKENESNKSKSHPAKYYLSKSQKVFGFKCT